MKEPSPGCSGPEGSPGLVRAGGRAVELGRAWVGLGSALRCPVAQAGPRLHLFLERGPPGCWPEAGSRDWELSPALHSARGDGPVSSAYRDSAPKPSAQTMSRVARKAEVLADPSGAQTPSLAMGQMPCQLPPTCSPRLSVHPSVLKFQVDILVTQACRVPQCDRSGALGPRPRPGLGVTCPVWPQFSCTLRCQRPPLYHGK